MLRGTLLPMKRRDPRWSLVLPPSGGYRNLVSFQVAELIYGMTVRFIDRYIPRGSRTADQMEQSARSGVRNIAEGSVISATSKKLEINLTNVARASLDELKSDYEDFLKHRKLSIWPERDPRRYELTKARCKDADELAQWIRMIWEREKVQRLMRPQGEATVRTPISLKKKAYAEISANVGQALCIVALELLDKQVNKQAWDLEKEGGFSERLYKVRRATRGTQLSD
jgi:four helix bundle suffix protein